MAEKAGEMKNRRLLAAVVLVASVIASAMSGYYGGLMAKNSKTAMVTESEDTQTSIDVRDLETRMSALELRVLSYEKLLENALGVTSSDDSDESEAVTLSGVQDEIDDIVLQMGKLEARIAAEEADSEADAELSSFEIKGPQNPSKNYALPGKLIAFRGRTLYTLTFEIRMNTIPTGYKNIIHVGDTNPIRSPAIWTEGGRRLYIRQGGEVMGSGNHNRGCYPKESDTPPQGTYFRVDITGGKDRFEVKYNGALVEASNFGVLPPLGQQIVFFSNPWHPAAEVTIKNMKFEIH